MYAGDRDEQYDIQVETLVALLSRVFQFTTDAAQITTEVYSIVEKNSTYACAQALALALFTLSQSSPGGLTDVLVKATTDIFTSTTERQSLIIHDKDFGVDNSRPFKTELIVQLAEILSDALHETALHTPKHTTIAVTNPVLAAALLSGSGVKSGLMSNTNSSYHFAAQGLQLPNARLEPERQEVVTIGTCLQLLMAGATMMEQWFTASPGLDGVITALKRLKEDGVVKFPGGVRLLEETVSNAQNNFSREFSSAEAWELLFDV